MDSQGQDDDLIDKDLYDNEDQVLNQKNVAGADASVSMPEASQTDV